LETDLFGDIGVPVYRLNEPYREPFTGDTFQTTIPVPTFAPSENHFIIAGCIEPSGGSSNRAYIYPEVIWNYLVIDINGTKVVDLDYFLFSTRFPPDLISGGSHEMTITLKEGPEDDTDPIQGALITLEVVGPAEVSIPYGITNAEGKFTFTITAQKVTENATFLLFVNCSKEGFEDDSTGFFIDVRVNDESKGNRKGGDDDGVNVIGLVIIIVLLIFVGTFIMGYSQGLIPFGTNEKKDDVQSEEPKQVDSKLEQNWSEEKNKADEEMSENEGSGKEEKIDMTGST